MKHKKLSIKELNRKSVEEYKKATKLPFKIVLDNIRSAHNVGAVFRIADAFLVKEIYLCGITPTPPNRDIHKTALGAEQTVSFKYFESTQECIFKLKKENINIIALEQARGSISMDNLELLKEDIPVALVLGNEVSGVSDFFIDICDICLEIPQFGTKHSLNVSTAASIACWEISKRLYSICD